jgi:hypothetical protein
MFGRLKSLFGGETKGPPSAESVARRAAALHMVITFAMVRASGEAQPEEGLKLMALARAGGNANAFSPWEREFLTEASAAANQQNLVQASWRVEALGVLLWSLHRIPWLPAPDEQFTHDIADKIPADADGFFKTASLRPREQLEKQRELAELWHWRSRTRQLIEKGEPFPTMPPNPGGPEFKSYDDIVRFTAKAGKESGTFAEIVDEDFLARGKAYRNLTAEEWSEVGSITVERHFALNWLCGYAPGNRWDETPTGT